MFVVISKLTEEILTLCHYVFAMYLIIDAFNKFISALFGEMDQRHSETNL